MSHSGHMLLVVLRLCREAVGVFYSTSRLQNKVMTEMANRWRLQNYQKRNPKEMFCKINTVYLDLRDTFCHYWSCKVYVWFALKIKSIAIRILPYVSVYKYDVLKIFGPIKWAFFHQKPWNIYATPNIHPAVKNIRNIASKISLKLSKIHHNILFYLLLW